MIRLMVMGDDVATNLEQQVAALERTIQEKRAEVGADTSAPYERSEVHTAVGQQFPQKDQPTTSDPVGLTVPQVPIDVLAPQLQELVNIALTKSVPEAIAAAEKIGNPRLIDALHDALTDEYHQQLIEKSKLPPVS